ncbi:MAG: hypothetical protein M1834_005923 [Cirrosporium novae-zelandiae]|nr:MAG: hypothetical protein M1834_005923 [Cirrosporium novae-zelandiae]
MSPTPPSPSDLQHQHQHQRHLLTTQASQLLTISKPHLNPPALKNLTSLATAPEIESIAASLIAFTDDRDAWTTAASKRLAEVVLEGYLREGSGGGGGSSGSGVEGREEEKSSSSAGNSDSATLQTLQSHLLTHIIKPAFTHSSSKNNNPLLTPLGRKAAYPILPKNANIDFSDDNDDNGSKKKPWKNSKIYVPTVLRWVLVHLDASLVEQYWPLIIPPLLALLDDEAIASKTKGCELIQILVSRSPPSLLAKTGLGDLFEDALLPCLLYLPTLISETESLQLLRAVYPALICLANARWEGGESGQEKRLKTFDRILQQGVLGGHQQAGDHVKIADVLVENAGIIVDEMGIYSVKYLKVLLPLLSDILAAPFATAYPPLLLTTAKTLKTIILNDWPRITFHEGELLRGLTVCWCKLKEDNMDDKDRQKAQEDIKGTVALLINATGGHERFQSIRDTLINEDDRLKDLFLDNVHKA